MSILDNLKPADDAEVMIYKPYHQGSKQELLPKAITLYKQGNVEGQRQIEDSQGIPFVATWYISKLPGELTRVQLIFDGNPDLSYSVGLQNYEFMDHLIQLVANYQQTQVADFPKSFYQRLLNMAEVS
jgi:hypothetical protein